MQSGATQGLISGNNAPGEKLSRLIAFVVGAVVAVKREVGKLSNETADPN